LKVRFKTYLISQWLLCISICLGFVSEVSSQEYFQQEVNYTISVKLNDKLHELDAFETIEYINNSPDSLQILYFHLWPNAYSNNNTDLAKQLFSINGKSRLFKNSGLYGGGKVLKVEAGTDEINNRLMKSCITQLVKGWTLPTPSDGKPASVEVFLVFNF
jgi:hypothetical protein